MKDGALAETDDDIFKEAQARLDISATATSEDRITAIEDLSFLNGNQWDDDVYNERTKSRRPALTINHTQTYVRRIENTLKQQRPRIKCHPVSGGVDIEDAKVVNGLIRHIETLSNASVAYDIGGSSAIKIGWGYWRIIGEYCDEKSFDQELKIKPIRNTFTVYDDPDSVMPAGEDRKWCILSEMMKRTEYKLKYPKAENSEFQGDAPGDSSSWDNREEIRLAEYYRIVEKPDTLYQLEDGTGMLKSEFDAHEKRHPGIFKIKMSNGKPVSRETSRNQIQWFRLNGKKIIDRRELPGKYIPLIRCEGNVEDINGVVKRSGMVRDLKDPARMYNYWRTAETERYALAPKAPWVMAEGQADGHPEWDFANQTSYSRLEYKPVTGPDGMSVLPPPMRQNPVPVESGMSEAAQGAEHDLAAVAGYMPENPQERASIVSGNKYLQRRQGMADLVHWHYYDNQTYSIMMTGVIVLDLIPWYYDTSRMQRIIGDDGIPQTIGINQQQEVSPGVMEIKNNLTVGKYDVVMDTGPGYQTKREESAESMIQILGTPLGEVVVKTGADVVLRNMDFNGADVLADRAMVTNPAAMDQAIKELPEQARNIIGAMQTQLKQAQDTIQQQAQEIKYRMGVEQMKDQGQTRRTLMTVTGQAHDTEMTAQTADKNSQRDYEGWMQEVHINANAKKDVAEIGAAASLLNTRAEAEADEKAAKRMIEAGTQDRPN